MPKKNTITDRMMRGAQPTVLICLSECVINGFGTIEKDAEVTDPALVSWLLAHNADGEHPNFKIKEG